jgi:GTP 3',8-cyclase
MDDATRSRLIDTHNRNLTYLRVSVTDRCNLRCTYCAPSTQNLTHIPHKEILRYEEILRIVRIGVSLGISKVRITGGEPLVRRGIHEFLEALGEIEGISDISLTTNGVLLAESIPRLKAAGIRRLNISLDTLDPDKYARITGRDWFEKTRDGIEAALEAGFFPIKLNAVAMRGVNDDELADLARLSVDRPLHVRFIEYMPIGDGRADRSNPLLGPEILERIQALGPLEPVDRETGDGPAERFRLSGARGEIGLIRPLSHHFCAHCTRLRLTASGSLRPCLLSDRHIDVRTRLRRGCLDPEIVDCFLRAVKFKPMQHHLNDPSPETVRDRMSGIGG